MAVCAAYNKKDTLTYTDEDGIHVISQGGCCRNCGYWQELNHECLKIGNPNYSRHTDSEYKCEDYRYFEE
jgi:Zn ribbon nucleic-acid-binding protein